MGEALIGFIEQSSLPQARVLGRHALPGADHRGAGAPAEHRRLIVASTIHNQRGECVMTGENKYLVRLGDSPGSAAGR